MAQNMYRVGDYVYFEVYPSAPYQIRRIDELNKTTSGTVEAKVTCFFRRRDLPVSLLKIADQAERQDQILWRPRRCLLSRYPLASTSNGELKTDVKENGVDNSHKSSLEPDENSENNKECDSQAHNEEEKKASSRSFGFAGLPVGADKLPPEQIHALRQRELFLSRQSETLPATQIRGKCAVVILNEIETCDMYLERDDAFFYSLVYDPANQTLLADKGKIEIGERHQADIPEFVQSAAASSSNSVKSNGNNEIHLNDDFEENKENGKLMMVDEDEDFKPIQQINGARSTDPGIPVTDRESVAYHPHHNLTDRDIDQFLIIARAVGTFSRALDSSSSMRIPSLHMTASAASRDVTLLHAMALLHQARYDIGQATKYLVPPPLKEHYPLEADKVTGHNTVNLGGPILCRDQLEEWSAAEATLFEDAIEKYGKDFHDIRVDCLPWKSVRDIVEYYYMWKTTARYTDMQKNKLAEQEKLLKQVYIPSYNKANPNLVGPPNPTQELVKSASPCESCKIDSSTHWYAWGPAHFQLRLCNDCWVVWKKRGGLKCEHEYESYDLDGISETSIQQQGQAGTGPVSSGTLRNANVSGNRTAPLHNRSNPILAAATGARTGVISSGVAGCKSNLLQVQNSSVPHHFHPNSSTPSQYVVGARGRVTFFLNTTLQARIARRIAPKQVLNMRKAARTPFKLIDGKAIQNYYFNRSLNEVLRVARQVRRGRMSMNAIEYLTKLHTKNAPNNGNIPTTAMAAASPAAAIAALASAQNRS